MLHMIGEIAGGTGASHGIPRPASVCILSGDIHFSYMAQATMPQRRSGDSRVYQLVGSPIRNTLARSKRRVMRFAISPSGVPSDACFTERLGPTWLRQHGNSLTDPSSPMTLAPSPSKVDRLS
jgi:hypothetical protein